MDKFKFALSKLGLSSHLISHRLEVETGRWARPNAFPLEDRHFTSCHLLEDQLKI